MDRILGQDRAIQTLLTAVRSGKLHHAYIFHGPAGVGKFTTAYALAKLLLCHQPQADLTGGISACGACDSCRLLRDSSAMTSGGPSGIPARRDSGGGGTSGGGGGHPDLHVVTKELARYSDNAQVRTQKLRQIPIDVLRQALIEPVQLKAQMGPRKVFIVDEAELMAVAGQNVLLKTLEEPPAGTFIILVTAHEQRLLPTIRSRCQRVSFLPLPDQTVRQWIADRVVDLSAEQCDWLVRFAAGSFGRAAMAIEYGLTEWAEHVLPALRRQVAGRGQGDFGAMLYDRIDAFAQQWVDRHENASKEAANQQAAALMFALLADEARWRMAQAAQDLGPAEPATIETRLRPYLGVIDAAGEALRDVAANVNLSLVCDHLASVLDRCTLAHAGLA